MVDPIHLYQYFSDIPRALLVDHGFSQIGGPRFFKCSGNLMKTRRSLSQHNLSIKKPGMGHGSKRVQRLCGRNFGLPVQASIWFLLSLFCTTAKDLTGGKPHCPLNHPPMTYNVRQEKRANTVKRYEKLTWQSSLYAYSYTWTWYTWLAWPPPNHPTKPKVDRCAAVYVTPKTWRTRKAWDHANSWVIGYVKGNLLDTLVFSRLDGWFPYHTTTKIPLNPCFFHWKLHIPILNGWVGFHIKSPLNSINSQLYPH